MTEQEIRNIQNQASMIGSRTEAVILCVIDSEGKVQMQFSGTNYAISHALMNIQWFAKEAVMMCAPK